MSSPLKIRVTSLIVFKGLGKGVVNTVEHNIEFCKSLSTHPIDEVIRPLLKAGTALGKAMYCAAELAINDPENFNKSAKNLILAAGKYVQENPDDAIAAVVECILPLKAPSIVKLKQVQMLVKAVQEQEALAKAIQISTRITTPIKEILSEACAAAEIGIQHGKNALNNVVKVALQQPEIASVGDIAALRLPSECFNDVKKLAKEVVVFDEEFFRTIHQKIRNVGDDILDIMKKAGGHTLEKHVGQTNNELILRAMNSKIGAASSFTNKHTAINAVKENLRNNAEEIAKWLRSNQHIKQKAFEFLHDNTIGYGVTQGKKCPVYNLKVSKVVIEIDKTQDLGFKILTSFPMC